MVVPEIFISFCVGQSAFRKWLMKFQTLVEFGRLPVEKEFRDGEHTAIWTYARSKSVPVSASLWILGVWLSMNETS
jgi:hypothetical protein